MSNPTITLDEDIATSGDTVKLIGQNTGNEITMSDAGVIEDGSGNIVARVWEASNPDTVDTIAYLDDFDVNVNGSSIGQVEGQGVWFGNIAIRSHITAGNPHSDSASQTDLSNHTSNTSNPHSVGFSDVAGVDVVDAEHINWDTPGENSDTKVNAGDIPAADSGGYFPDKNLEDIVQLLAKREGLAGGGNGEFADEGDPYIAGLPSLYAMVKRLANELFAIQGGVVLSKYLLFGYPGDLSASGGSTIQALQTAAGSANGQGYRMPSAGKVVNVSAQFDVASDGGGDSDDTINFVVQKNGSNTAMYTLYTAPTTGDAGVVSSIDTAIEFNAGDRLQIETTVQESGGGTLTINDIAGVIEIQ